MSGASLVPAQGLSLFFNLVARVTQAGSIDKLQAHSPQRDPADQVIACRAGLGTDQGRGRACQGVEEAALAGIGPASQDYPERLPGNGPLVELLDQTSHLRHPSGEAIEEIFLSHKADILLREVEPCFHLGEQVEEVLTQPLERPADAPGGLGEGLAKL